MLTLGVAMRNSKAIPLAILQPPSSAMTEQFDLVCTWVVGNLAPVDSTLRVDTERNTVNGGPATISDAEIRLERTANDGSTVLTVINRYTRGLYVNVKWPSQVKAVSGRGKCTKATQRQF